MDDIFIQKILLGDTQAYRYFISKYKDMAYSIAMSIVKDEFDAEDVMQVSFIKAFENLAGFNKKSKFSTWLYKIVINESFKLIIKNKKRQVAHVKISAEIVHPESMSPFLSLQEDEQRYYINEALKKLQPKESLVLRLFYLEQYKVEEIGEVTGWSSTDIKVTLHRARLRLKQAITTIYKLDTKELY